jgi:hypothetical protein
MLLLCSDEKDRDDCLSEGGYTTRADGVMLPDCEYVAGADSNAEASIAVIDGVAFVVGNQPDKHAVPVERFLGTLDDMIAILKGYRDRVEKDAKVKGYTAPPPAPVTY